jgi:hypothetical protein
MAFIAPTPLLSDAGYVNDYRTDIALCSVRQAGNA